MLTHALDLLNKLLFRRCITLSTRPTCNLYYNHQKKINSLIINSKAKDPSRPSSIPSHPSPSIPSIASQPTPFRSLSYPSSTNSSTSHFTHPPLPVKPTTQHHYMSQSPHFLYKRSASYVSNRVASLSGLSLRA